MEIKDIITLIQTVSASNLTSFCYEENGTKLMFELDRSQVSPQAVPSLTIAEPVRIQEEDRAEQQIAQVILSPMVGTYYASGSEDGMPFVEVGDVVKQGQIVGIVEAMKLMNEIESPYDGVVSEILVKNKEMVGFNQPLIKLRPR